MGFPFGHGLRSTLIASRLADGLSVDPDTASQTYYVCLLSHAGCTTDAHVTAQVFGGSLVTHLNPGSLWVRTRGCSGDWCERCPIPGASAAACGRFRPCGGLPRMAREQRSASDGDVRGGRDAGRGQSGSSVSVPPSCSRIPHRIAGMAGVRLRRGQGTRRFRWPMRIVHVAADAALQSLLVGEAGHRAADHPRARAPRHRSGDRRIPHRERRRTRSSARATGPSHRGRSVWSHASRERRGCSSRALSSTVRLPRWATFADLISPYFDRSLRRRAPSWPAAAAPRCGFDPRGCRGRCQPSGSSFRILAESLLGAGTWQKPGPLSADEWEASATAPLPHRAGPVAVPVLRPIWLGSPALTTSDSIARAITAAPRAQSCRCPPGCSRPRTSLHAMTAAAPSQGRPWCPEQAAREHLAPRPTAGRCFIPDAVAAVIGAAGQRVPRIERPAGLTEREVEVVGMLARGLQTKQLAREARDLGPRLPTATSRTPTRKIGISTRAPRRPSSPWSTGSPRGENSRLPSPRPV